MLTSKHTYLFSWITNICGRLAASITEGPVIVSFCAHKVGNSVHNCNMGIVNVKARAFNTPVCANVCQICEVCVAQISFALRF